MPQLEHIDAIERRLTTLEPAPEEALETVAAGAGEAGDPNA